MHNTIERALKQLAKGKMIVLTDDVDRENEGDLVCAAEKIMPAAINFMIKEARGLVCLSVGEEIIQRLRLPMMTTHNTSRLGTAFTVSVEAKEGVGSGISAFDRAHTIQVMMNPNATSDDIVMPGHIFPLQAKAGGVFTRRGHTEGSLDLVRLAGCRAGAVVCEVVDDRGEMARGATLKAFAKKHHLPIVSIQELLQYRFMTESVVERISHARLPLEGLGEFTISVFKNHYDTVEHVALVKKPFSKKKPVLVRIHSECLTGDVFGSLRCDCHAQQAMALQKISKVGGIFLYMRQEGRGIGLGNKIKAYALQEKGHDTVSANQHLGLPIDAREYGLCAQMLQMLGVKHVRLLTNNPHKLAALKQYGLGVTREALTITANAENKMYLKTKKNKLGHWL